MKNFWAAVVGLAMLNGISWAEAPAFSLSNIRGEQVSLSQFKGKFVVLEWTNYECPFVKKHYNEGNMQKLQQTWTEKGVAWLSICSSAEGKQGYMEPANWVKEAQAKGVKATEILLDPDGRVGKSYKAKTTPHMFVIDPKGKLIYQGALDEFKSFDDDVSKLTNHVNLALNEAMAGKKVSRPETKPYGCSVKY